MTDIADLFALDPLLYTKDEGQVKQVVAILRERRAQFNLGSMKAGAVKPSAPRSAAAKAASSLSGLSLSSLLTKKP